MGEATTENPAIAKSIYGKLPDGRIVYEYSLVNANGVALNVIAYGGKITSLKVPDKNGKFENVVLRFDSLENYLEDTTFFGSLIGRFGNRIANGKFSLNGEDYTLAINNAPNHLHGGPNGFDKVIWNVEAIGSEKEPALKLTYFSEDGEEGYPGNLKVTVIYSLTTDNALEIEYFATTDKTTILNLTQHAYFNLSGDFNRDILDHEITINGDAFLPIDENSIPLGHIEPVGGTPFDFTECKVIQKEIYAKNKQLEFGNGYDHCWVINGKNGQFRFAASAYNAHSGRLMEAFTSEPGMQFYTGNFIDETMPIPGGGTYKPRSGFCFETQHFPNSPNESKFPSVVLNAGETYRSKTSFKFSVKKEE